MRPKTYTYHTTVSSSQLHTSSYARIASKI